MFITKKILTCNRHDTLYLISNVRLEFCINVKQVSFGIGGNLIMQNPNRTLLIINDICLKVTQVIIKSIDIYHKTD
jgi:hypothetical protein